MAGGDEQQVKHADTLTVTVGAAMVAEAAPAAASESNPLAGSSELMISVPETVEVRLVDARVLGDYEVWALVSSIVSSAVIALVVAWLQAPDGEGGAYLANASVFGVLLLVAGSTALAKRRRLNAGVKRLRFRIGEQVSGQEP